MRRGATKLDVIVWCVLSCIIGGAATWIVEPIFRPADIVPPPIPAPAVYAEPELVIVTDASGKRVTDSAVETAASKLAVGTWNVLAIPKPGEVGWSRSIVVSEVGPQPVPPTPIPPTPVPPVPVPVPPQPVPPPVVEGKRAVLIIRESADDKPELARLITGLRIGTNAAYLTSKGHTLAILDDDAKDESGQPSPIVAAWRPFFADLTLPALLIVDPASKQLVHREAIGPAATADSIVATLKAKGG